jgi:hypothetical protein
MKCSNNKKVLIFPKKFPSGTQLSFRVEDQSNMLRFLTLFTRTPPTSNKFRFSTFIQIRKSSTATHPLKLQIGGIPPHLTPIEARSALAAMLYEKIPHFQAFLPSDKVQKVKDSNFGNTDFLRVICK